MVSGSRGVSPEPPGRLGGPCAAEWTAPCPARLQWWQWKGPLHGAGLCIEGCSREPPGRLGGPCAAEWTAPLSRALAVVAVAGAPAWWRAVGSHRSHRAGWVGPALLSGQPLCPARCSGGSGGGPCMVSGSRGIAPEPPGRLGGPCAAEWTAPLSRALAVVAVEGAPAWWRAVGGLSPEPPGRLGGPCAAEWTAPLSRALAVVAVEGAPAWCWAMHRGVFTGATGQAGWALRR